MDMIKFLNKRKKENRQSLIIDNLELVRDQVNNRRNSYSETSSDKHDIASLTEEAISNDYTPVQNYKNKDDYKDNYKENEIFREKKHDISKPPVIMEYRDKPIVSGISESQYYNNSTTYSFDTLPSKRQERDEHKCNICNNQSNIKDSFMILTCGHIFHIKCLVDNHYLDANKYGVIDEEYLNSRSCTICNKQMEMEDILYIHNKFYKNTKEYINKQDEIIEALDRQMTKLKEELRTCYEYKQKLEHQREKSRQITVTINTLM